MNEFLCNKNYGPHHGSYRCFAHMSIEVWRWGRLISWITFEAHEARYVQ